jgi:hypothetical protein
LNEMLDYYDGILLHNDFKISATDESSQTRTYTNKDGTLEVMIYKLTTKQNQYQLMIFKY